MIQIKTTTDRDLDQLCENHYQNLEPYVRGNLAELSVKQRGFIEPRIKQILTSKPKALIQLYKDFVTYCTTGRHALLAKNVNNNLKRVFNYKYFTKTDATYYCGYTLSKSLRVNTCCYCNRNYTVTVDSSKRTTRPDFDHFFAQKHYPLLALSFYNLIPSCLVCNRTIKNQQKIVYGKYIHPYEEGFGDTLKFNFLPMDADSAIGMNCNYKIVPMINPLEVQKGSRCQESFNLFQLKDIYEESHVTEIADIVRKHHISNGKYLETMHKSFPDLGTIEELFRIAFGNYYNEENFEKRPLAKLTKDTVDQLIFTYPIKLPK